MDVRVTHRAGRIHNAHKFDMVLGEVYDVELIGVRGSVAWHSQNDEVLAIEDDSGHTGRITATAIGESTLTFVQHRRPIGDLHIEVYLDPTVTVGMRFGNVRDREK